MRAEAINALIDAITGKTISQLLWDPFGHYWVMRFTDGTETCWFANMCEADRLPPRPPPASEPL